MTRLTRVAALSLLVLIGSMLGPRVVAGIEAMSPVFAKTSGIVGCSGPCDLKTSFLPTNVSSDGSSTPVTSCGISGLKACTGWTADAWQSNASCPQGSSGNLYTAQDGVYNAGGSVSAGTGSCDEVITAANYSGGDGGRGFRHYRDIGSNQQGGGIRFDALSNITTVANLRYMIRWSSGFTWGGGFGTGPHYSKDMNVNNSCSNAGCGGNGNFSIAGYEGGSHDFGVDFSGSNNVGTGEDWVTHYGGLASDARWDCVEVQWDITNHGLYMWLNNVNVISQASAVDYKSFVYFGTVNVSNQEWPTVNGYTDFDDVIIERDLASGSQIGCPGGVGGGASGGTGRPRMKLKIKGIGGGVLYALGFGLPFTLEDRKW